MLFSWVRRAGRGWVIQGVTVVVVVGLGGTLECRGETLECGGTPRMVVGPLEWEGGPLEWGEVQPQNLVSV